jgi:superfamily II DNA or RNA helicase/HKD family nuclease
MKNFISNSDRSKLKDRIIELVTKSKELKFLVGFFYFSGIRELYESLKNKDGLAIKVMIGLNADTLTVGLTEYVADETHMSDEERIYKFFDSVKRSLNTDDFDNKDFYEQVRFFIRLIKDGRLVIRKTYEPNHAKLYIFKLQDDQVGRQNLFITGSSNLTRAGLTTQNEFNVEISDFGVEDAEKYFDDLWSNAVKITEDDTLKQRLIELVEKETHIKEITPFEAFVLVLKAYLDSQKFEEISKSLVDLMEEKGYKSFQYQLDAARQALAIIKDNRGVVIADVVGLGKSVIASLVARSLGRRGVIICPPGLIGDRNKESGWQKYSDEFELHDWEIRSSGDLDQVAKFVKDRMDIEVVLVDEAHRFRNQDTKDYEHLKNICRGRVVILLTATPFNNTPDDILSLLELFIVPKRSRITLEDDLRAKFRMYRSLFDALAFIKKNHNSSFSTKRDKAQRLYEKYFSEPTISLLNVKGRAHYLSRQIRNVIEPVTIRRNRLDLLNDPEYKKEVGQLSLVEDPQEWFFELTEEQSRFYDEILETYFADPDEGGRFKGAIYRPFEYQEDIRLDPKKKMTEEENTQFQQQRNLFDFMRRMLVKRFESSFGAFHQSISNFLGVHEKVSRFIEKSGGKYILDRGLIEAILNDPIDDIEQRLKDYAMKLEDGDYPKNNRVYEVNSFARKEQFIKDIQSDIKMFQELKDRLSSLQLVDRDPKAACLVEQVKKVLNARSDPGEPKRKVIIFSEYGDTVKHVYEKYLKNAFRNRVLVVEGSLSVGKIKEINHNFDASLKDQPDDFDILISTDKISEGFNLNRAGMIINYDIPWNPVRVIQRVGRINRISRKVFDKLFIVNFFPTERGANIVRSRDIAQHKMFLIHNTLGEDSKIFDVDEEPAPASLFARINQNPDKLQEESFYTRVRREMARISSEHPEVLNSIAECQARVKVAKKFKEDSLLVFIRKGRLHVREVIPAKTVGEDVVNPTTMEDVFDRIVCGSDEKAEGLSENFWERYQKAKDFREQHTTPLNDISLEKRAFNSISTFLKSPWNELMMHLVFLRTLREDISDYGTLPDYTLRRLANLEFESDKERVKSVREIAEIRQELGEGYLNKEKARLIETRREVIIAIENRSIPE